LTVRGKSVHAANCTKGISAIAEAAMKITELEKLKDPAGITCSCGTISGGTAINTVPEECSFTLDVRFSNAEETDFADMRVREIAEHSFIPGSSCTVELISRRAAMVRCERNLTLLDRMNAVYEAWGLPVLSPEMSKGGSDAADVTLRGIPCVDSIGVTGGGIHTVREYAEIDSLTAAAKRIATVFYSL
ncbi:MAG: M20/M25/M40 family metallo-hydrolase, partial [Clostridiales bacterium]|nr:M20/M25/M40 family metallo-hydrolase [Clostridiales bacterium]